MVTKATLNNNFTAVAPLTAATKRIGDACADLSIHPMSKTVMKAYPITSAGHSQEDANSREAGMAQAPAYKIADPNQPIQP